MTLALYVHLGRRLLLQLEALVGLLLLPLAEGKGVSVMEQQQAALEVSCDVGGRVGGGQLVATVMSPSSRLFLLLVSCIVPVSPIALPMFAARRVMALVIAHRMNSSHIVFAEYRLVSVSQPIYGCLLAGAGHSGPVPSAHLYTGCLPQPGLQVGAAHEPEPPSFLSRIVNVRWPARGCHTRAKGRLLMILAAYQYSTGSSAFRVLQQSSMRWVVSPCAVPQGEPQTQALVCVSAQAALTTW